MRYRLGQDIGYIRYRSGKRSNQSRSCGMCKKPDIQGILKAHKPGYLNGSVGSCRDNS